jgi:hypothetical protein
MANCEECLKCKCRHPRYLSDIKWDICISKAARKKYWKNEGTPHPLIRYFFDQSNEYMCKDVNRKGNCQFMKPTKIRDSPWNLDEESNSVKRYLSEIGENSEISQKVLNDMRIEGLIKN